MLTLPSSTESYWMDSTKTPRYPQLSDTVEVDVAIIGAGIAGLTTAYLLKQSGLTVAVIEKDTVSAGVSGHTTGKVTSQHNLIYTKLSQRLGSDTAKIYGQANEAALAKVEEIIKKEKIECDWTKRDNYVYTTNPANIEQFRDEAETAQSLGLPATFETMSDLPFSISAAVRFSNQASFHVRKYLLGLAKVVHGNGSYVFEHSHVFSIHEGSPGTVRTPKGKVIANDIVVATNVPTFPLMARGAYCIAEYPKHSYIVAGKTDQPIKGMYTSPDSDQYSILPIKNGSENLLLIGGRGHVPGTRINIKARYQTLANYAKEKLGVNEVAYRWSHRDYLGYDDMPLIGLLYPWSKHTYMATAFMKWGLTNGTMAGMLLTDMICGNDNPWAKTFDPHRIKTVTSIPKVIGENLGLK